MLKVLQYVTMTKVMTKSWQYPSHDKNKVMTKSRSTKKSIPLKIKCQSGVSLRCMSYFQMGKCLTCGETLPFNGPVLILKPQGIVSAEINLKTCSAVNFPKKWPNFGSLQACNFTKNYLFHTYLSIILARF